MAFLVANDLAVWGVDFACFFYPLYVGMGRRVFTTIYVRESEYRPVRKVRLSIARS
jgi:hypothetical protein